MGPAPWWKEIWVSVSLAPFNLTDWRIEQWSGFAMLHLGPIGLSIGWPRRDN